MVDLRPQLLGRGTYGPYRPGPYVGPRHLWDHVMQPPAQNSILIYKDGTVVERSEFDTSEINDPDVYLFILGGTDYRCGDDQFVHDALIAAGYTCGFGITMDVYVEKYTDEYPLVATDSGEDAAAAAARVKAQRIADLEAELARLKGTP